MSDFKAKMYQIQFLLGELTVTVLPRPPIVFKGPTSKGREGKGSGRRRKGRGLEGPPFPVGNLA